MSRFMGVPVVVAVMLLASSLSGCGSSNSPAPAETTTETTPVSTTAGSERLTTAQWQDYQTSRAALRKANARAATTFKACGNNVQFQTSGQMQKCTGNTYSTLATTAGDSYTLLTSFESTVAGACADSLAQLANYVGTFKASAANVQAKIDNQNVASYYSASSSLELARTSGRASVAPFERDCAPA